MKRLLLLTAVVAALGLVSVNGRASAGDPPSLPSVSYTLYAGQSIVAGTVDVTNDASNLYVTFNLNSDWCMTESHVAVATSQDGIPQTKNGNPIPGQFPYQHSYGSCVTTDTYTIPWSGGTPLVIAAHAALYNTTVTTDTVASAPGQNVWGPLGTYTEPDGAWGSPVSAVVPTFASAGVWPTLSGAQWISTAATTELDPTVSTTYAPDSWRMAQTTLNVPSGAYILGGSVTATSDNAERVWNNGSVIGEDGTVEGPFVDQQAWKTISNYSFTPVHGANTLSFVWRNYGYPYLSYTPASNPNGLLYKASVSYYADSESAWAANGGPGTLPFDGNNWATYFNYDPAAWSLSLSINPKSVVAGSGSSVTFTGTLSWIGSGSPNRAGQTVTIQPYGTDKTCTTPAGYGPWNTTTASDGTYSYGPVGASAGPGTYYYTASSDGIVSGCKSFTITPAASGDITLDESGGSSLSFSVWFPHQGSAGYVHGSLGYTASPTCVHTYGGTTVVFEYQIPPGSYSQAGLWVVWKLTEGRTTAGYSYTPTQSIADGWCASNSFSPAHTYTITSATDPVKVY